MTQQYLAGELSLLLARLQATATDRPLTALTSVVVRALALTDRLCWGSLQRGDTAAFTCQAAACAELREFGLCAGLLEEDNLI